MLKKIFWVVALLLLVWVGFQFVPMITSPFYKYDVLIKGGTVYDGTLAAPKNIDIGVKSDKIIALGSLTGPARKTIDAKGLVVTPGFIDVHNHTDLVYFTFGVYKWLAFFKPEWKGNYNYLTQGVTTIIDGNCGYGFPDLDQYFGFMDLLRPGTNVYSLAPHGYMRNALFGEDNPQPLTEAQLEKLKNVLEKEMQKGAVGMSTGLEYQPGAASTTDELIELGKVLKKYNGFYVSHIRDNTGQGVLKALKEAIEIGKKAGIPVHISHLQIVEPYADTTPEKIIKLIKKARAEGLNITADSYPYDIGNTWLMMISAPKYRTSLSIRPEYKTGSGREEFLRASEADLKKIDCDQLIINSYPGNRSFEGKSLAQIAKSQNKSLAEMYVELARDNNAPMVLYPCQDMRYVKALMPYDYMMSSSDGAVWTPMVGRPHPRSFGAFPKKMRLAIDEKLMGLPAAIRSMTSYPAEIFRLKGRGRIAAGYYADLAVIDLPNFRDKATVQDPTENSTGIRYLLVNGVVSIDNGKLTGKRGGRSCKAQPD